MESLTRQDFIRYHLKIEKLESGEYSVIHALPTRIYKLSRLRQKRNDGRIYFVYKFRHFDKTIVISESRLIYVYEVGDIPKNYDVVHIDKNLNNNKVENLKLVARSGRNKRS